MRCIEMAKFSQNQDLKERLTLTWDVLKYPAGSVTNTSSARLTLTWDVLK